MECEETVELATFNILDTIQRPIWDLINARLPFSGFLKWASLPLEFRTYMIRRDFYHMGYDAATFWFNNVLTTREKHWSDLIYCSSETNALKQLSTPQKPFFAWTTDSYNNDREHDRNIDKLDDQNEFSTRSLPSTDVLYTVPSTATYSLIVDITLPKTMRFPNWHLDSRVPFMTEDHFTRDFAFISQGFLGGCWVKKSASPNPYVLHQIEVVLSATRSHTLSYPAPTILVPEEDTTFVPANDITEQNILIPGKFSHTTSGIRHVDSKKRIVTINNQHIHLSSLPRYAAGESLNK